MKWVWWSWFTCIPGVHAALRSPDAVPPKGGWAGGTGAVCFSHFCFVALEMVNMWMQVGWIHYEGECPGSMLGVKTEEIKCACLPILVITGWWFGFGGALTQ